MSVWAVVLAAGSGSRLAEAGLGVKKQFLEVGGAPLFWLCARTFSRVASLAGLVFVFPADDFSDMRDRTERLFAVEDLGLPYRLAVGGARRQDSVRSGLAALPADCRRVLIHDAARPFVSAAVIQGVVAALDAGKGAVIPVAPLKDTIKRIAGDVVVSTPPREELVAVQTPQGFERDLLLRAFAHAEQAGLTVTDDAGLVEGLGLAVHVTPGAPENVKITTPEDLRLLAPNVPVPETLVGYGYDAHRYAQKDDADNPKARPMKLGGVLINSGPPVLAHSDGDVLYHALTDAILGCLGRGDIGSFFPDSDPQYDGIESGILLSEVLLLLPEAGLTIVHVDLTIVAQIPKIGPHREAIRKSVAGLLGLAPERVGLKATTEEGMGFTGEKKGIKAVAVVTARRDARP